MKSFSHALQALVVLASASVADIAQASLIAQDLFNYSGNLAGQSGGTGWAAGGWMAQSAGSATVSGTGLTYTDGVGNTLIVGPNEVSTSGITQRSLSSPITNSTVWASVLVQPTEVTAGDSWGLLLTNLTTQGSVIMGRSGSNGSAYDLTNYYTNTGAAVSGVSMASGTTALLVGEFQIASDDTVTATLFVNPTLSAATPTGGVTYTSTSLSPTEEVFGPLAAVQLYNYFGARNYNAGDLHLGTTYADVTPFAVPTPEPSAALLLTMAGVLGLGWRFARRIRSVVQQLDLRSNKPESSASVR